MGANHVTGLSSSTTAEGAGVERAIAAGAVTEGAVTEGAIASGAVAAGAGCTWASGADPRSTIAVVGL